MGKLGQEMLNTISALKNDIRHLKVILRRKNNNEKYGIRLLNLDAQFILALMRICLNQEEEALELLEDAREKASQMLSAIIQQKETAWRFHRQLRSEHSRRWPWQPAAWRALSPPPTG